MKLTKFLVPILSLFMSACGADSEKNQQKAKENLVPGPQNTASPEVKGGGNKVSRFEPCQPLSAFTYYEKESALLTFTLKQDTEKTMVITEVKDWYNKYPDMVIDKDNEPKLFQKVASFLDGSCEIYEGGAPEIRTRGDELLDFTYRTGEKKQILNPIFNWPS